MYRKAALMLAIAAAIALPSHAAQRAFVASYGNDANTASNCTFASPCRGFAAALTVVDPGGDNTRVMGSTIGVFARGTAASATTGALASGGGGSQYLSLEGSQIVDNSGVGLRNMLGTVESLGNNIVRGNGTNTSGTITVVAGT